MRGCRERKRVLAEVDRLPDAEDRGNRGTEKDVDKQAVAVDEAFDVNCSCCLGLSEGDRARGETSTTSGPYLEADRGDRGGRGKGEEAAREGSTTAEARCGNCPDNKSEHEILLKREMWMILRELIYLSVGKVVQNVAGV